MKTGTALCSKGEIKILHAVAGRVRLGFTDSRTKEVITNTIVRQLRQQEEIKEIRINESLNNMLILFDANKLSLSRLFSIFQENGFTLTSDRGLTGKAEIFHSDVLAQVGSGLQSIIPPAAGLLTSSCLGMQGWRAIVTYLVTSGVTREVIEQLPLELTTTTETKDAPTRVKPLTKTGALASYKIVHATGGRIRLRVPRITWDWNYAGKLADLLASNDNISSVRVNPSTGSVVVTYRADAFTNNELPAQTRKILANIFEVLNSTEAIEALEPLNNKPKRDINSMSEVWEKNLQLETFPVQEAELIEQAGTETNRAIEAREDSSGSTDAVQIGLWSRFKSCMLSMMLKLMASLPVQQPAKV